MEERQNASWLSKEGMEINEDRIWDLYKIYCEDQRAYLGFHYRYKYYYTLLLSALLAVFVGGILEFHESPYTPVLFAIPILMIAVSTLGRLSIDRYYKRFLESITICAKIENVLGLDRSIRTKKSEFTEILWSKDKQLLPYRWMRDRTECGKYESSEDFIDERMNMGDNKYARWTFWLFGLSSVGLILVTSFILWMS